MLEDSKRRMALVKLLVFVRASNKSELLHQLDFINCFVLEGYGGGGEIMILSSFPSYSALCAPCLDARRQTNG